MTLQQSSDFRRVALALLNYWSLVFVVSLAPLPMEAERAVILPLMIAFALPIFALACYKLYRAAQANSETLAYNDELTGIGNRRAFVTRARKLLKKPKSGSVALVLLDVDGLKILNDECGHQAGDELIASVGARLRETHGSAYRIGGDEFAVLVDQSAGEALNSVLQHLEPYPVDFETCGHRHNIGLSYGHARSRPGETMEDLVARADARLRQCKRRLYGTGALPERRGQTVNEEERAVATLWENSQVATLDPIRRARIG